MRRWLIKWMYCLVAAGTETIFLCERSLGPTSCLSLSFNSHGTSPLPVWKPCESKGLKSRPAPHHASSGTPPCSGPLGRSPAAHKPVTHTILRGHSKTWTPLIQEAEFPRCSWCVWAGSSWRAERDLVSARTPQEDLHQVLEPPSLCRYLSVQSREFSCNKIKK